MSLFDQPYYALTKALMSRMGIWPEQSKYVRIILPTTMFVITLTLIGPALIELHDAWRDINILVRSTSILLIALGTFYIALTCIQHVDNMKLSLKKIKEHWETCKNTPAVIVLDKYAERGRHITVAYAILTVVTTTLFFCLCLSPIILDYVDPVNETRPKMYILEAEYGVDADKYYWFIITHTYIVATMVISMIVAIATMYILWVVHACALFEVVGFNLELIANEYTMNKENAITLRSDSEYKKICDCISLHAEAISFADLIEEICSEAIGVVLGISAIITVMSGIQVLINRKHLELLMQQVTLIISHVLYLYIITIPGQELINRSGKIHTTACVYTSYLAKKSTKSYYDWLFLSISYNLDWQDISANARKLLILILMRSNKPCYFTAGKVYVLSMETFGSAIRLVLSYFTIFAQMIE